MTNNGNLNDVPGYVLGLVGRTENFTLATGFVDSDPIQTRSQ
ncbi:MAG: hypothetical protein JWN70_6033 [Planctomycetaceae bacterium]|nr:hypothetical protein [Planctomycetaceae bacterium]